MQATSILQVPLLCRACCGFVVQGKARPRRVGGVLHEPNSQLAAGRPAQHAQGHVACSVASSEGRHLRVVGNTGRASQSGPAS